jgi:hypothetical protein
MTRKPTPKELLASLYQLGHLEDVRNPECESWMEMIIAVDQTADFQPLFDMLQLGAPTAVMPYLEDLFARFHLLPNNKKSHAGHPLYYPMTRDQLRIAIAVAHVKHRPEDMTEEDAIQKAAKDRGLTDKSVRDAFKGKHSSFRRAMKNYARRLVREVRIEDATD